MPIKHIKKRQQKSKNNKSNLKCLNPSCSSNSTDKASRKSIKIQEIYSTSEQGSHETLNYEEGEHTSLNPKSLSRTSILILDYLQFKAARCIQRFVRGWLKRILYKRKKCAALVIQTEWRRFYARRLYYRKLEDLLQQRLEEHYYKSAQKIQALWRGWWIREHVHDHRHLIRMQLLAGEDLLHCVAFKLHHLLRTHQIPGIYSLRNSSAFSKVEALLASMTFKTCTERVRKAHDFRQNQINQAKKQFVKSAHGTRLPYPGPNIYNACRTKCIPLYNEKEADRKMTKILRMYEEASSKDPRLKTIKQKTRHSSHFHCSEKSAPTTFCDDVVHSMKKWKIIAENNLQVDASVLQQPENLEHFLKEIKSWWSLLHDNNTGNSGHVIQNSGRKP